MEREIILSIETAVHGGSISILENRTEIAGWQGTLKISKAEDVLEQISNLFYENTIEKSDIKTICVSKGAGSLTGEKIGLALAAGLAKSLNCRQIYINVFESLLLETGELFEGDYLTVVPFGKNQVQWQVFRSTGVSVHLIDKIQTSEKLEFFNQINCLQLEKIILDSSFRDLIGEDLYKNLSLVKISSNSLAKLSALQIKNANASDNELAIHN